jgi:alpha-L-fucosidase
METNAFVHFGPNTFTDREWGEGTEDPNLFNPSDLDCDQWVNIFKQAGIKGVIITAKHHDGFCMWPSKLSTHTVAQSSWQHGKGDVLRNLSEACDRYHLGFGVYLSPWDRNHPKYGTPEYNQVFAGMLHEVLGNYGKVFEVWFDGANGEGPNGKKQVYDWNLFNSTVRKLQPSAVIFSDGGPGVRWVGNEGGQASLTSWSMIPSNKFTPGHADSTELGTGSETGDMWCPPECDVSIRPGWFYHPSEEDRVKTPEQILDLYEHSVGRNGVLLLNVPPDRRGHITDQEAASLLGFRELCDKVYGTNLAAHCKVTASSVFAGKYGAWNLMGEHHRFWAAGASDPTPSVTVNLRAPVTFDRVMLQEPIWLGQRVSAFTVEADDGNGWKVIATGTTIGHKRILPVEPTTATHIRITINGSRATPALSGFGLYRRLIGG